MEINQEIRVGKGVQEGTYNGWDSEGKPFTLKSAEVLLAWLFRGNAMLTITRKEAPTSQPLVYAPKHPMLKGEYCEL